jgi:predicted acyltransferase
MPPLEHRFRAIDVLRGLTLALMIVVNMQIGPGRSYVPLLHAPWNGLTPTDVVFPTFMFVVGAALSFTLGKYATLGNPAVLRKVATRSALIFLCGYLLYWFPFLIPISETRVLGVLQRIAIGYGAASLIVYYGGRRAAIGYSIVALLGYWALLHACGDYSMLGNAGTRFDKWVLGEAHMYHGEGFAFDPEGILSTIPAIVNVLAGYLAARFIRDNGTNRSTIVSLVVWGAVCIGLSLCWNVVLPINKKIWTSSFVLCTVGIDLVVLAILSRVVPQDEERRWTWFFEVFGRNTLAIYLLAELGQILLRITSVGQSPVYEWLWAVGFAPWAGDELGSLLCAVVYMLICWVVACVMDRRRIYIRL